MSETVTMQPEEFLAQVGIKVENPERVITAIFSLLFYLQQGDTISTNQFTFNKLDGNTLYMESKVDRDDVTNMLSQISTKLPI